MITNTYILKDKNINPKSKYLYFILNILEENQLNSKSISEISGYSENLCKESFKELEIYGYLQRTRYRAEKGFAIDFKIYEKSQLTDYIKNYYDKNGTARIIDVDEIKENMPNKYFSNMIFKV